MKEEIIKSKAGLKLKRIVNPSKDGIDNVNWKCWDDGQKIWVPATDVIEIEYQYTKKRYNYG